MIWGWLLGGGMECHVQTACAIGVLWDALMMSSIWYSSVPITTRHGLSLLKLSLFDQFGGHAHIAGSVSPAGPHMARFMHQDKRLVAAFVHACWLLRSSRAESLDMLLVPVESDIEVESDELLEVPLSDVLAGRD